MEENAVKNYINLSLLLKLYCWQTLFLVSFQWGLKEPYLYDSPVISNTSNLSDTEIC